MGIPDAIENVDMGYGILKAIGMDVWRHRCLWGE